MDLHVRSIIGIGKNVYGEELVGLPGSGIGVPADESPSPAKQAEQPDQVPAGKKPKRRITFEE